MHTAHYDGASRALAAGGCAVEITAGVLRGSSAPGVLADKEDRPMLGCLALALHHVIVMSVISELCK